MVYLSLRKKDTAAIPTFSGLSGFAVSLCMAGAAAELGRGGVTCLAAVLRCLRQDTCFPDGRITKLNRHESQTLLNSQR